MSKTGTDAPAGGNSTIGASSSLATIGSVAVTTIVAAAIGFLVQFERTRAAPSAYEPSAARENGDNKKEAPPAEPKFYDLPAVVTNLAFPAEVWIRLEVSILIDPMPPKESSQLLGEIAQDTLAFMRTVSLPQLQGADGLTNLREDIEERVTVRSKGRANNLLIRSLVLQ